MKKMISGLFFLLPVVHLMSQQTLQGSILHDGLQREYILYVPASYTPGTPVPLVLNFHGYTSNALEQMFYGDFRPIADTAGFIIVHPMGTVDILGNTHWNVGWGTSSVDDVGFASDLIDSLSAAYSIDPERIYSTGMSNGGFFSYTLACELSDRIAAIASVTGSMNNNQFTSCHPEHPMPVMEIHGTADGTVAYDGNILFAPIPSVLNYWVSFNHCSTPPVVTPIEDTDTSDGCTAERQFYAAGTNGATVEHYKINGGAHTWPGSAFGGVGTNQDIDASKEIWNFFSKYNLQGLIGTTSVETFAEANTLQVYPNPAGSFITIKTGKEKPSAYALLNTLGQQVLSGILDGDEAALDLGTIPSGMYFLSVDGMTQMVVRSE